MKYYNVNDPQYHNVFISCTMNSVNWDLGPNAGGANRDQVNNVCLEEIGKSHCQNAFRVKTTKSVQFKQIT